MQASNAGSGASAPSEIAARLRQVREALGLSQAKFAELLGFKREQVISVEYGKAKPSPEMQAAAIQKASVNPIWLANGSGQMLQKQALSFDEVIRLTREAAMEAQSIDVPAQMQALVQDWLLAVKTRNAKRVRELIALQEAGMRADVPVEKAVANKLDAQVLDTALEMIDAAMLAEGVTVAAKKRASLIAAVYDMCRSGQPSKDLVRTLVRLAA